MSKKEFDKLPDYSHNNPTDLTVGKRWKRTMGMFWYLCEVFATEDPDYVNIKKKRIGVLLGSIHDSYATKTFPEATIMQYQNLSDMLFGLNSDKVDVAFMDHTGLKDVFSKNPGLGILAENVFAVDIAAGFNQQSDGLREQFNAFLKEIKSNGIYRDMEDRWMTRGLSEMPGIKNEKTNGQLKAGIVSDLGLPTTIIKDGKLVGFDIEIGQRFAASIK